jgi:hypothetical protein
MNRVCPNVRHENITLWSFSWRLKFIRSQFPLPMALNSEQKEIFIQYSQQVLYVHARRVLSIYTCMIFILRETRTTVREWACWLFGTEHFKNAIRAHKHFLLNMGISGYIYACACIQWLKVVMTFHYAKYDRIGAILSLKIM